MLLSALGFIPVVGIFADIVNGVWYWAEGDYFSAIGSFISAVPMIGDTVGIFTTTISGCTKAAKIISYGTRMFAAAGNMALSAYQTTQIACDLYDKHHNQGLEWDSESTSMAVMGVIALGGAAMSAADLAKGLSNFDAAKYDIETSQCFVAGTLVLTDEGNKPIEEIKAGDFVYSTNPETGESEYKEVVRAFRKESDVIIHIFVNGEEIETTPSHPFWVENEWVSAKDLREGDILTLADGSTATITKTYGEQLDEPVIVYNFEVKDFHTYYVTNTGVLVHNDNKCTIANDSDISQGKNNETELFLPDEFYEERLPKFVTPGTQSLTKYDEFGNLKQIKYYDEFGREMGWIDFTDHGYSQNHTIPHWHEVQWNAQYPIGGYKIDHRMDTNPPFIY